MKEKLSALFGRLVTSPCNLARNLARDLVADRRGNVMMVMGFMLVPMLFAVGFGLDYGRAMRAQTKLAAIADSAALLTVSPAMMAQSDSAVAAAATNYFNAQVSTLAGVTVTQLSISAPTATSGALAGTRTATVTFKATSSNLFSSILGSTSLPITGSAKADASTPPSMNFYVALDTSPSMLLPTTSTGISQMIAGAKWQGESYWYGRADGCAFACHTNDNQQWNQGIYVVDNSSRAIYLNNGGSPSTAFFRVSCSGNVYNSAGTQIGSGASVKTTSGYSTATFCSGYGPASNPVNLIYKPTGSSYNTTVSVNFPDTWWLAQNNSLVNPGQSDITLRTDAEGSAAAGLISYAYSFQQTYSSASSPPTYKLQFYTFNVNAPAPLSTSPFGTMTAVSVLRSATFPDLGAQAPLMCANSKWTSCSQTTNNADTSFATMLTGMQSAMPTSAGTGTTSNPQNVLIIITDGAEDSTDGMGPMSDSAIAKCAAIKATGARIAILYTEYRADTINYTLNPTFNNFASGQIPNILPKLKTCATQNDDGSYLMQTVSTDGDLSAALNKLFAMTVKTARIVH